MINQNKFFINENGTVEGTLLGLLFSLTFASVVIAFLLLEFYGVSVAGIELPSSGTISGAQNFKTNDIVDNVNYVDSNAYFTYVPNVGRVLTSAPPSLWGAMYLAHIEPNNDIYTISYSINNSVKGDYAVFVRASTSLIPYNERIDITSSGFRIPNSIIDTIESNFYPYPNANQITNVKIKTVFNKGTGKLEFYFNNQLAFTKTGIPDIPSVLDNGATFYAGVSSKTVGFTVESIDTGGFNFSDVSIIGQVAAFLEVLGRIVLWNVDEQFLPLALNILFIKTQLAGIIICIIVIIRG